MEKITPWQNKTTFVTASVVQASLQCEWLL